MLGSMELLLMVPLGLISTGLVIYTLVILFQEPRPERKDYVIGAVAAAFLIAVEAAIVVIFPKVLETFPNPEILFFQSALVALKFFICAVVGIKLSRELGFRWSVFESPRLRLPVRSIGIAIAAVGVLMVYSYYFLQWQQPQLGIAIPESLEGQNESLAGRLASALGVLEFAVLEELMYRGCFTLLVYKILTRGNHRYLYSALIVNLLWTFSHFGSLDPAWVKFVQIFPLGLLCAWLMRRFGIEYAIGAHALFNVGFVFVEFDFLSAVEAGG